MIKINTNYLNEISEHEVEQLSSAALLGHNEIKNHTGAGNDFLGWVNLPTTYDKKEFSKIKEAAKKIQKDSEVLIVIGIGGSYLGAKAVIELLTTSFYNETAHKYNLPQIYFVGNHMSSEYMADLADLIREKEFSINVISKSGTTTEPAIAFRYFKNLLVEKYQEEANSRIYATTDKEKGALKEQAIDSGWSTFVVPDDIGGRYSVLTAVGLLPIAVAGIDVDELMSGAQIGQEKYNSDNVLGNDAYKYAILRNIMYAKGKNIEILVGYEPKLTYFNEWWKQLYGESEGKDNKGLYPSSLIYSQDLHSLGQYLQEGRRNLFETVINIGNANKEIMIQEEENNLDQMNYLKGKNISYVNQKAFEATAYAHEKGGVPSIVIELDEINAKTVGELIYFFEKSCAISGYMFGVNPFNQPGVEAYKNKMFELLEKPGY